MAKWPFPYRAVRAVLGEPFINGVSLVFPDDADAVDVCWCAETPEGKRVGVWNFKNGPVYTGAGTIEEIADFSVYCEDEELYEHLTRLIETEARRSQTAAGMGRCAGVKQNE